jgi:hypothetical protein
MQSWRNAFDKKSLIQLTKLPGIYLSQVGCGVFGFGLGDNGGI